SLALVVSAFQFVATFRALATLDTGFRQSGIVEATVNFKQVGIPPARGATFRREVVDRIRAIPGVASAANADILPVSGASGSNLVWLDGATADPERISRFNTIGDRYFTTLGIPLLAGRDFDARLDTPTTSTVAVVNETFARRF